MLQCLYSNLLVPGPTIFSEKDTVHHDNPMGVILIEVSCYQVTYIYLLYFYSYHLFLFSIYNN